MSFKLFEDEFGGVEALFTARSWEMGFEACKSALDSVTVMGYRLIRSAVSNRKRSGARANVKLWLVPLHQECDVNALGGYLKILASSVSQLHGEASAQSSQ